MALYISPLRLHPVDAYRGCRAAALLRHCPDPEQRGEDTRDDVENQTSNKANETSDSKEDIKRLRESAYVSGTEIQTPYLELAQKPQRQQKNMCGVCAQMQKGR